MEGFILTKNTLTLIYSYLLSPTDMRSFMMVSRLFHQAGVEYPYYHQRIQKILEAAHLKEVPIKDSLFRLDQTFFALCFVSCKSDEELSQKLFKHIKYTPLNESLIHYLFCCMTGFKYRPFHGFELIDNNVHGVWFHLQGYKTREPLTRGNCLYDYRSDLWLYEFPVSFARTRIYRILA